MCSPGWGNLVAIDWNDLPVGRNLTAKFLKNVKSPPCLPLPRRLNIDRCITYKFPSSVHSSHYTPGFDMCPCSLTFGNDNRCVVVVIIIIIIYFFFLPQLLFPESSAFSPENFKFLKCWWRGLPPPPPLLRPGPYAFGLDSVACTMQSQFFVVLFFLVLFRARWAIQRTMVLNNLNITFR